MARVTGNATPAKPTKLSGHAWGGVLRRTFSEFSRDNLTDWAAALTYYGILSIFPALIALVDPTLERRARRPRATAGVV